MPQQRDLGMVDHPSKASGTRSNLPQAAIDLAREGERAVGSEAQSAGAAEVELALADLVSDANGEVVIFNDSGFRTLALHTDLAVVGGGQARRHVTAGGEDVSGFNYVTFGNGVTVYFQEGLNLIVQT
jgi:hypothetical protein